MKNRLQVIDVLTYHGEGVATKRDNGPEAGGKIDYFAAWMDERWKRGWQIPWGKKNG